MPLLPRGSERRPVPEADFSVPEVFKDGGGEGFFSAAAELDAVAPMVLPAAGERGDVEGPGRIEPEVEWGRGGPFPRGLCLGWSRARGGPCLRGSSLGWCWVGRTLSRT